MDKTRGAYKDEMVIKVEYVARLNAIEQEINELKSRIAALQAQLQKSQISKVSLEQIELVLGNFLNTFSSITREQRKRLLQLLIHQITIGEDCKIESI